MSYVAGYVGPLNACLNYPFFFSVRDTIFGNKDMLNFRYLSNYLGITILNGLKDYQLINWKSWLLSLIIMIIRGPLALTEIGKQRKNIQKLQTFSYLLQLEYLLCIMAHNSFSQEEPIQQIDRLYGLTWTKSLKCINIWQLSLNPGRPTRFGKSLRFRDTQIIKYLRIVEENSSFF